MLTLALIDRHPDLFKDELGKLIGQTAKIYIDKDEQPRFLHSQEQGGGQSEPASRRWCHGVRAILGLGCSIGPCHQGRRLSEALRRLQATVNRAAKTDTYPLPRIESLFASLARGTVFSKLNLSHAYLQVPVDDDSKEYLTVNTHKGLFRYNRLLFNLGLPHHPPFFKG